MDLLGWHFLSPRVSPSRAPFFPAPITSGRLPCRYLWPTPKIPAAGEKKTSAGTRQNDKRGKPSAWTRVEKTNLETDKQLLKTKYITICNQFIACKHSWGFSSPDILEEDNQNFRDFFGVDLHLRRFWSCSLQQVAMILKSTIVGCT